MSERHEVPSVEEAEQLIEQAHAIDELVQYRGKSRRAVADAIALIEVLPHAVKSGRIGLVDEYVERALERLRPYAADSEECIHPGVFATGRLVEHCYTCNKDVPREEL